MHSTRSGPASAIRHSFASALSFPLPATAAGAAGGIIAMSSPCKNAKSGYVFRFVVAGVSLAGLVAEPGTVTEGSTSVP